MGDPRPLRQVGGALYAFDVPLITVTSESSRLSPTSDPAKGVEEELLSKYDNVLTTVPDRAGQIRVSVAVVDALADEDECAKR